MPDDSPCTDVFTAWREHWHPDTPETLFCDCGHTILGDGPPRNVQCCGCWVCMRKCEDGTVCHECFEPGDLDRPGVTPLSLPDSDPDGFTCVRCGQCYTPGDHR